MLTSKEKSLENLGSLFQKTSLSDTELTIGSILREWKGQKIITIHFIYFANIWIQGFLNSSTKIDQNGVEDSSLENCIKERYYKELLNANFLLPDGIAFRLLHFAYFHPVISRWKILLGFGKYSRLSIPNMNGTDFVPKFLAFAATRVPKSRVILYGSREIYSAVLVNKIKSFGFNDIFYCDGYGEFDFTLISKNTPCILLVGLGSPKQELWVKKYRTTLESHANELLIISVGGLFDFWSGIETRAPYWMRRLSLEWVWRSITNPKKNLKKTIVSLCFFWVLLFVR